MRRWCPPQSPIRSWRERIAALEKIGFIKTQGLGAQKLKYVLLTHPVNVVQALKKTGDVDDGWWETYRARRFEVKEPTYEDRPESRAREAEIVASRAQKKSKKLVSRERG